LGLLSVAVGTVRATPPATVAFEGVLKGVGGADIDGAQTATFTLYDAATAGNALWTETKTVSTANGVFVTALGDTTEFPSSLAFDRAYWVGVKIGADPEMTPRLPLSSVPYALALPNVTIQRSNGYVGINTSSPAAPLHVVGNVLATSATTGGSAYLGTNYYDVGFVSVTDDYGRMMARMTSVPYTGNPSGGRFDVLDDAGNLRAGLYTDSGGTGILYGDVLQFTGELGDKVYLWGNNPDASYGLGVQSSVLQIHADLPASSVAIGYGGSADFHEKVRVTGSGRVGIGTTSPTETLDVRGNVKLNSAGDMYASGGQENLYIVRGVVNSNGTTATGAGFTVTRTSTGHYTVTLTNGNMRQPPAVTVTPWTSDPAIAVVPYTYGPASGGATFKIVTYLNGTAKDYGFMFTATGPH
jgi:hypothetical protein